MNEPNEPAEYALARCEHQCLHSYCHTPRSRIIYGLYDARNNDVFYVGSTFDMARRFREHLRYHPYVQAMMERGLLPLPIVLCEFTTWCDVHSRLIEQDITRQLREQGHSAFGDDTSGGLHDIYTIAEEQAWQLAFLRSL